MIADRTRTAQPTLTFIVATLNKRRWLAESLPHLIAARRADDEIIVIDGGSSDGTVEMLSEFANRREIDHFVSESDLGESHAMNKAILLSRCDAIKIITDDDVFSYPAIDVCRQFMRENPSVDLIVTPVVNASLLEDRIESHHLICGAPQRSAFGAERHDINTTGLGVMIRRSAIAIVGLFDTRVRWVDYEWLMRAFHCRVEIGWYTSPVVVRLHNAQSVSHQIASRLEAERRKFAAFYSSGRRNSVSVPNRLRGWKSKAIRWWLSKGGLNRQTNETSIILADLVNVAAVFDDAERVLAEYEPCDGEFRVSPASAAPTLVDVS